MTPLQRYIAEEIATDHVDGLLTRREAMRRLGLLGMGAAAASALIAACNDSRDESSPASSSTRTPTAEAPVTSTGAATAAPNPPGSAGAVPTSEVTWAGPRGELRGAWAGPADGAPPATGAVLVIHENKGLTDWVRSVTGRFAGIGYPALAVDLLSGVGGTASFSDPAAATAALSRIAPADFVDDLRSGLAELARRVPGAKQAVVGFCMGGGLTWQLLAAGEPRLAAAVPFYGPLPDGATLTASTGSPGPAVLAFYGAKDTRVTSTSDAAAAACNAAGLVHDVVVESDADHAFFNDTGARYDPTAAADAWRRVGEWFDQHLRA